MRILQLDQLEVLTRPEPDLPSWTPVRHLLGIDAFGINAWHGVEAGDLVIEEHHEVGGHQELYVVAAGRARFVVDGEEADAPAGTLVAVDEASVRTATALEPGTVVFAIGSFRGQAFEPADGEQQRLADAGLA